MAPSHQEKTSKPCAKRVACKKDNFLILLDYFEEGENSGNLFSGRKTTARKKNFSNPFAWEHACTELRKRGFPETTGEKLHVKWDRYVDRYRDAKFFAKKPGGGLTDDEIRAGLTLEEKLNGICEHYYKMHDLIGARADMEPPAVSGPMGFGHFSKEHGESTKMKETVVEIISSPSASQDGSDSEESNHALRSHVSEDANNQTGVGNLTNTAKTLPTAPSPTPVKEVKEVHAENKKKRDRTTPKELLAKKHKRTTQTGDSRADQDNEKTSVPLETNLAAVYVENKMKEVEMRLKYAEKKEQWKVAEIREKRDARLEESKTRMAEIEEKRHTRLEDSQIARDKIKKELVIAGWNSNKTELEIVTMINLVFRL